MADGIFYVGVGLLAIVGILFLLMLKHIFSDKIKSEKKLEKKEHEILREDAVIYTTGADDKNKDFWRDLTEAKISKPERFGAKKTKWKKKFSLEDL